MVSANKTEKNKIVSVSMCRNIEMVLNKWIVILKIQTIPQHERQSILLILKIWARNNECSQILICMKIYNIIDVLYFNNDLLT